MIRDINIIETPKERYSQMLTDERWILKAENIRIRDNHTCRLCKKKHVQLDVHHIRYIDGRAAWDYDDGDLATLCHECHEKLHERQAKRDSFYRGCYFYSNYFQGVGIVTSVDDSGINFEVCWTENLRCINEERPRLYLVGSADWNDIRHPTYEEICDFWDKCTKYCHPETIDMWLTRYFKDYLEPSHPIIEKLRKYQEEQKHGK